MGRVSASCAKTTKRSQEVRSRRAVMPGTDRRRRESENVELRDETTSRAHGVHQAYRAHFN